MRSLDTSSMDLIDWTYTSFMAFCFLVQFGCLIAVILHFLVDWPT